MTKNQDLDAIFLEAIEIEELDKRTAFLMAACGADSQKRSKVEKLLAAHDKAGSFMRDEDGPMATIDHQQAEFDEGAKVGNYRLLQQIGEGGFGAVYMAEQQQPVRRKVALKIVKPGMDSRDVIARFEAERQALALMDHPNIAKVLDAGTTDSGRPFFVMELVKGVTVTEYCDKNRLTTRERLELFVTLCHAVQHAHQKGVIHRDIKPSNIMVTLHDGKPVPKVIDFGVSKALNQQLTEKTFFTRYGQMIGTPQYMSPEQAEMSGLDVDTRSDIFSLGVVLYELLTGQTPLGPERLKEAGFLEMQQIIQNDEPARPSVRLSTLGDRLSIVAKDRSIDPGKLRQMIQGELDWIVMKALEKDRSRRYETASSFAHDVVRYLDDEPIEACPPSTIYRFRKFARRNKGPVAAALAVSMALVVGIVVATIGMATARSAQRSAEVETSRADKEATRARGLADKERKAKEEADARRKQLDDALYAQRIAMAYQHVRTHRPVDALKLLKECPEDLRDFEWFLVKRLCHDRGHRTVEVPDRVHHIAVRGTDSASDGEEKVLVGLQNGRAIVFDRDLRNSSRDVTFRHEKTPDVLLRHWIQLNPRNDMFAAATMQSGAILKHLQTDQTIHTCTTEHPMTNLIFSPNGKYLATIGKEPCVRLWDVATGSPLENLLLDRDPLAVAHCFSPDGSMLAAAGADGELKVWKVIEGPQPQFELQYTKRRHWAPVTSLCFSPDNKQLASAGYDRQIIVRDSKSGELLKKWLGGRGELDSVTYNPRGTRLVSACHDGTLTIWDTEDFHEILVLRDHDYAPRAIAFSSDGQTLYSGGDGQKVHVWDGSPWDPVLTRVPIELGAFDTSTINAIAIKPDGSEIAAGGEDGVVKTFQLPSHDTKEFAKHGEFGVVFGLAYEKSGQSLISSGWGDNVTSVARRWNTVTGDDAFPIVKRDPGDSFALAISPTGDRFVVAGVSGQIDVYQTSSGRLIGRLGHHERPIVNLVFSPNGRFLVSATDEREIKLWDAQRLNEPQEGETILNCRGSTQFQMGFDPQGLRLALGDGNDVLLYEVEAPKEPIRLIKGGHGDSVNAVAFSHNGQFLASGSSDGTVKLWNTKTDALVETLHFENDVHEIAFTPDDAWLATAGEDTHVKLWNLSFLTIEDEAAILP